MNDDQAPGRRERLERAFLSFLTMLREYADLVVAAGVAVYVATEAGVGNLDGDRLTEATAILLGCLAFAFVRERWTRKRGFEEFSKYLKTIAEKAEWVEASATAIQSAAQSSETAAKDAREMIANSLDVLAGEKPYEVLKAVFAWEMLSCDGKRARASTLRDLRFTANNVFCIYEHLWAEGKSSVGKCYGTIEGQPRRELQVMPESFPGPEEKQYTVIGLGTFVNRGQRMTIESPRTIEESFTGPREFVQVDVESITDRLEVQVVWPADCRLTSLEVRRRGSVTATANPAVEELEQLNEGRRRLLYPVERPSRGDKVFVIWEWNGAADDLEDGGDE